MKSVLLLPGHSSPDATLLVDVAGGLGHDIDDFKKMYPNHPGDLPVVINDVEGIDTSIELMGHDFLIQQPIKGAKAYFMHSIVHGWPDDLSTLERTEDHWHQLVEERGLNLRIVKFWKCGQSDVENLIECELVAQRTD
ncbi:hypothetical protein CABS01_05095 [Colletotrichum abscissum]|uniref:O-methyltransferase C-terminal domain-containing protein n=1 Tax=Colletotrichum abscissum TaxID=1671311 RepID=A0A9Q0AZH3_9PEZI|nr:uncharacterized protein CABS01_05095 [Colletotrichum abscissum]KAI3537041.1 hypothetical protein CABS02_12315 [Colletotrichum abscissum]KAK1523474.1 hypothetical protein CABS01_05095 [Colletotrichum abscissum]